MPQDLLGQMSRAAQDDVLADPRWEDFARGSLTETEKSDLVAKARTAGIDDETVEALGPRDPVFDERLAQAALAAMKARASNAPASNAAASNAPASNAPANRPDAPSSGAAASPVAKVIPLRSRRPAIAAVALGLAAAAAVLVWSRRPTDLPVFAMTIEGGTHDARLASDDTGGVVNLAPGNRVVVTLRPDARARRQLAARAFLYGAGRSSEWGGPVAVADTGSVRVIAPASELFRDAPPGRWKLCVSVGDPGDLPDGPGAAPPPARASGFVTVCRDIEWTGAPPER